MPFRVDIEEDDKQFRVLADLPGVSKEHVDIQVDKNILTITAKHASDSASERGDNASDSGEQSEKSNGVQAIRRERFVGAYQRRFTLPDGVDAKAIDAELKDGVLVVSLPKSEEQSAHRIVVK